MRRRSCGRPSSQSYGSVVCLTETSNASANQPEEGRRVFGVIEEIGQVEGQEGEIIGGIYAGVNISKKPLVEIQYPLSYRRIMRESIPIVRWSYYCGLRCVDIIAFVELAL